MTRDVLEQEFDFSFTRDVYFAPHMGGKWFFNFPPWVPKYGGKKKIFPPGSRNMGGKTSKFFGACGGLARNAYVSEVFWTSKSSFFLFRLCLIVSVACKFSGFGLLSTKQSTHRTGAILTFCEEQKALLLMVKLIYKRSGYSVIHGRCAFHGAQKLLKLFGKRLSCCLCDRLRQSNQVVYLS